MLQAVLTEQNCEKLSPISKSQTMDILMIDGQEIRTENLISIHPPVETSHCLGHFHMGCNHVSDAIDAAMRARDAWVWLAAKVELPFS